jgi:CRISPR-associated protein Cas1
VTHPLFGYGDSYCRVPRVPARLLARAVIGEVPGYVAFTTR